MTLLWRRMDLREVVAIMFDWWKVNPTTHGAPPFPPGAGVIL